MDDLKKIDVPLDEAGLPVHLRFPLTVDHQGPAKGDDFHHWGCWCVDGSKCTDVFVFGAVYDGQ